MELRHLRYFAAVAAEQHVHRAAQQLRIAQPALTQQIKALEAEMGVRLFERSGRGIILTPAGRAFEIEVKAILSSVDRAVERVRDIETGHAGVIRIGFTDSASFHPVVTEILKAFRARWPRVVCRLEENHTEELIAALESGEIDAAFVRPPIRASAAASFRLIVKEPLVAAMPVDHRLADFDEISITSLKDESFVTYHRRSGAGLSEAVLMVCREAGFMPRITQQTPQLSSAINLVAAGMGVAVVPESMRHLRAESLRFVPLVDMELKAEIGFATMAAPTTSVVENLLDVVNSIAAKSPD